jgi:hypothetical protein
MKGILSKDIIFSLIIASMVVFSVLNGVHNSASVKGSWVSPSWRDFYEASDYLKKRCTREDVILNNEPFAMYLETGCKTVSYYPYYNELPPNLSSYIDEHKVTYVVLDDFNRKLDVQLLSLVESTPEGFERVFSGRENLTVVYQLPQGV